MSQDDKVALKEFLVGALNVITILAIIVVIIGAIGWGDSPTEHEQETKVVGQYKECDIVQWHYGALAEYKYFLHCPK